MISEMLFVALCWFTRAWAACRKEITTSSAEIRCCHSAWHGSTPLIL